MATVYIQKRQRDQRLSYIVYYRDPVTCRNCYYKTFRKQKDAQSAANDLRVLLETGKLPTKEVRFSPKAFNEVGKSLSLKWGRRLAEDEIAQATYDDYTLRLELTGRVFGEKLLGEITEEDIRQYRADLARDSSNATANRNLFILKQVFKHGLEISAVTCDPTIAIKYLNERAHERNRYLMPKDLDALIAASSEGRAMHYLPALICLGAEHGTSRQEALSLDWTDVEFDFNGKGLIRFYRTKNDRERTDILMPRTRLALLAWKEHQDDVRKRDNIHPVSFKVFSRMDGTPIQRFNSAWESACRRIGLENFHYHDLRHTFCSNALLAGATLKDVSEMIGHADLEMTNRYSHMPTIRRGVLQEDLAKHYAGD